MSLFDRWRTRTDDARRTKGDPPPTYDQLLAQVRETEAKARALLEPALKLRNERDQLAQENVWLRIENDRLRTLVAEKTEYVETLALELADAKDPRPRPAVQLWTCPVEGHTKVEWRGDVAHCMTPECGRTSADVVDGEPKPTLRESSIAIPLELTAEEVQLWAWKDGQR